MAPLAIDSLAGNGHPLPGPQLKLFRTIYVPCQGNGLGSQVITHLSISLNSESGTRGGFLATCVNRLGTMVWRWLQTTQFFRPSMETDSSNAQGLLPCGSVESGTTRQGPVKVFL